MARTIRHLGFIALAAAALYFGWRWWFPSDEAQIHAVLDRIAEGIGSGASDGEVGRLARAAGLRNDLDPNVVIEAGEPFARLTGRDTAIGMAARLNSTARNLEVDFEDVEITVHDGRTTADVSLSAIARFDEGGGRGLDARELNVIFKRLDGRWVVAEVTLVRALQPIGGR